ncbi:MAG: hypothetical protein KF908_13170 [Nitrosomonas sp.]|nr:hypothetical protein [Nitrosomonas sp.]MBX3641194.1 hypothetical protein [Nitrosomonas sp.]
MRNKYLQNIFVLFAVLPFLTGCWMAAAAGAGAYGGYKMKEEGYTVQNPITKKKNAEQESEESD